jgi:hypothetical protein
MGGISWLSRHKEASADFFLKNNLKSSMVGGPIWGYGWTQLITTYIQNPCQGEFFMCFSLFFLPNNKDMRNPNPSPPPPAFLF